jgi:hypothetical protein
VQFLSDKVITAESIIPLSVRVKQKPVSYNQFLSATPKNGNRKIWGVLLDQLFSPGFFIFHSSRDYRYLQAKIKNFLQTPYLKSCTPSIKRLFVHFGENWYGVIKFTAKPHA